MKIAVKIIGACFVLLLTACMKKDVSNPSERSADIAGQNEIQEYLRTHNVSAQKDVSGLFYTILSPGDSTHFVKATSIVTVDYTNQLLNGQVVGASVGPTDFDGRMLKNHILGWQIGLQKISLGGKIRMYIPPYLAYGPTGVPGIIPPNVVLVSEVELVDIR
ncbi:Peptidyl-prolyl cis-trans isomerase [Chitinophaga sp. 180180018-2]|nr:Peptidyl-prolyl cis-trans isomerase [Chitinophaga sp. 212800010-3]